VLTAGAPWHTAAKRFWRSVASYRALFAHQKGLLGLTIRTIGLARAHVKIGLANLAYNVRRFIRLRTRYAPAATFFALVHRYCDRGAWS
jgi:hypothetical protein